MFKEKGILVLMFLFFYFLIEYVTFLWVDFIFLPKAFFIDFLLALFIGSLALLFKTYKGSIIYLTIVLTFAMTFFLINATMYSVYFDLFTLQQVTLLQEATDVFTFEFLSINSIIVAAVIGFSYFFLVGLLWHKIYKFRGKINNYYQKTFIVIGAIAFLFFAFYFTGIAGFKDYKNTANVTTFKRAGLEEYGILGYYLKEADVLVFGLKNNHDFELVDGEIPYEESLGSNYFGLLENANVITIMVESLQSFAVNEILTPNLYLMIDEGLYFSNNYSENKTNVSEIVGITGSFPTVPLLPKTYSYDFTHSLPYILNNEHDYNTAFFHDNIASFYSRNLLMNDMGFANDYYHEEMFPDADMWTWNGDYTLDSVTAERILNIIDLDDEPFYYFWSTMSMHGPYDNGPINKILFDTLGYFEMIDQAEEDGLWVNLAEGKSEVDQLRLRYYQAAVMDFDKALGRVLEELENKDLLDETILVLYGDHNVYYHNLHLTINDALGSEYYNMDLYEAFLTIYNPKLVNEYLKDNEDSEITKFTSPYNIVPTLFDLLGLTYNQNLMLGETVFLEVEEVFYSHKTSGLFNDYLYSNNGEDIIYFKEEVAEADIEDFIDKSMELKSRMEIIDYWYNSTKKKT